MSKVVVDIQILRQYDIDVNDYLNLLYWYSIEKNINEDFTSKFKPSHPTVIATSHLADKKFIFVEVNKEKESFIVHLRERTREMFEGSTDLFLKWFNDYPMKTPSGRVLRPGSEETIRGRKLRKKWNKYFKNKATLANKAIDVLQAELAWRRQMNNLEFMQMAETWLNQGSWEVYEHLLDEFGVITKKEQEDFI